MNFMCHTVNFIRWSCGDQSYCHVVSPSNPQIKQQKKLHTRNREADVRFVDDHMYESCRWRPTVMQYRNYFFNILLFFLIIF